jgi:hypothetical protein
LVTTVASVVTFQQLQFPFQDPRFEEAFVARFKLLMAQAAGHGACATGQMLIHPGSLKIYQSGVDFKCPYSNRPLKPLKPLNP